jgi:probable O-glycosylation ligase (exosortase A-associated)
MPESWHQRMASIEHAGDDASFLGRVMAWKGAILIALDNFTGGGFKAGQTNYVWFLYDPQYSLNWLIDTSDVTITTAKAAHSIYFQVLGDHGFLGLFLFLMMLYTGFSKARRLNKALHKSKSHSPMAKLSSMIQLSLVTYMVAGAAVSLAYFDLLYMIFALIFAMELQSRKLAKTYEPETTKPVFIKDKRYGSH